MNLKVKIILSVFINFILIFPIYILLHEGGHSLIAALCGAKITKFSILGAYMSYEGGAFTPITLSLFHVAGMLLPVLASVVYMLTYRDNAASIPYRTFSFFAVLVPIFSILAWVLVPVLYLAGQAPPNDDVTKFINHSGLSPWMVLFAAVLLFTFCILTAWKKKIIQTYWKTIRLKT
jgi:hypothetical protein